MEPVSRTSGHDGGEADDTVSKSYACGPALAKCLSQQSLIDPVVLALPRGGVPVGFEIARALDAPLDLVMVRKIGVPFHPELAAAAVVDGDTPEIVLNEDIMRMAGIDTDEITRLAQTQLHEITQRRALYLKGHPSRSIKGKTAIVVDDGIATGATMRAALKAVRSKGPSRVIMAVPVAPADTLARLAEDVDEVICLEKPAPFYAVGAHFQNFIQVSDDEVIGMMDALAQEMKV